MRGLVFACGLLAACGGDDGVHHLGGAPPAPDAGLVTGATGDIVYEMLEGQAPL